MRKTVLDLGSTSIRVAFDTSKPDGMSLKKVDPSKMDELGWKARTPLREGLQKVYCWFLTNNISKNNKL